MALVRFSSYGWIGAGALSLFQKPESLCRLRFGKLLLLAAILLRNRAGD